jgi:regulatory protein
MAARPPLSLKARALRWLAQREHSRVELRRKLMRAARLRDAEPPEAADAGGAGNEVDALLDWLATEGHLSQARFVESRLHARSARFGNRRIVQELAQHGLALDADAAQRLAHGELERARAVWSRKYGGQAPQDAAGRARQMRFLAARGFSAEVIRRVVRGSGDDD